MVSVSTSAAGVYGPASAGHRVTVVREPLSMSVEKPRVVFSGQPATISGAVESFGKPVSGCPVKMVVGDMSLVAFSDNDGRFSFDARTGWSRLSTRQRFTVKAMPLEPWVSEATVSGEFMLINTITVVALPFLALVAALARRRPVEAAVVEARASVAPAGYPELPGLPGVYVKAVNLVAGLTGAWLAPSDTIREYVEKVRPGLRRRAASLFERISRVYEKWLYSGRGGRPPLKTQTRTLERLRDRVEPDRA